LQTCRGRQSSLEALQDAALEGGDDAVAAWIERQQLQDVPRLLDAIEVDAGWERAVEAVLDESLGALCVQDLDAHAGALDCGPLMLLGVASEAPDADADSLLARVRCPWPLAGLLAGVRVAETTTEALQRRGQLARRRADHQPRWQPGRSRLGAQRRRRSACRRQHRARRGVARLAGASEELEQTIADLAEQQDALAERRHELEQEREDALQRVARLSRERATLDAELGAGRARLEHVQERRDTLAPERAELAEGRAEALEEIEAARERLHEALEQTEELTARRDDLSAARDALRRRGRPLAPSRAGCATSVSA
jgi:chromosome segregation protein